MRTTVLSSFIAILGAIIIAGPPQAGAQGSASALLPPTMRLEYEFIGDSKLKNPPGPDTRDMTIQTDMFTAEIGLPTSYRQGRTRITHGLVYRQLDFNYSNFGSDIGPLVESVHSIAYSLEWEQEYNDRWSSLVLAYPGLASDFEGSLSFDDTTIEAAVLAIYDLADRWNLPGTLEAGFGVGYSPRFGSHYPSPVLGLRWNNGRNMKVEAILPLMLTVAYRPHPIIDIGATASIFGGAYHGDPDKYGVDNPQMRYSVAKVGPDVTLNILPWLRVRLHGGYAFDRRVEFYDGSHEEASYNLEDEVFVMTELQIGLQ